MHAELGKTEAQEAAEGAEQQAFDEELADDAPAGCAECCADGDFALASKGTAEHHVRDIGAGDEQDKTHGGEHEQEDDADAAAIKALLKCEDTDTEVLVGGILAREAQGDAIQFKGGLAERRAGF